VIRKALASFISGHLVDKIWLEQG
jgi:hypothetical protein